jgi:acetylornithine/succinyldiaminopimelate/putrescine aminotransferase
MVGVEMHADVAPLIDAGYAHGLLMVNAGPNVIRFVPPLVLDKPDVDVAIERLTEILATTGATLQ